MTYELVPDVSIDSASADTSPESLVADGIEATELDLIMCHRYPNMVCKAPQGGAYEPSCPDVYATCWQYRIWNR